MKEYIKPSVEVFEMDATMVLCASNEFGVTDTPTDKDADLSNSYRPDRRGSWGNLWGTEED